MTKLEDLKGRLSIRAINSLKHIGYEYLEEVNLEVVEKRIAGKKTKKEIMDFIESGYDISKMYELI